MCESVLDEHSVTIMRKDIARRDAGEVATVCGHPLGHLSGTTPTMPMYMSRNQSDIRFGGSLCVSAAKR